MTEQPVSHRPSDFAGLPSLLRLLLGAVLVLCGRITPVWAEVRTIPIGVLSSNDASGEAHADSVKLALSRLGEKLAAGSVELRLEPRYQTYTSPADAADTARRLRESGVAVILGGVDSDSTARVVAAIEADGAPVPVLSSLSTAPSLTAEPHPWFFRATLNDRDRMKRYANFLTERGLAATPYVLVYDGHQYGAGLHAALREALGPADVVSLRWDELAGDASPESLRGKIPEGATSIFVLGPSGPAVALARRLAMLRAFQFFFVGYDQRLLEGAPERSFTIGEPTADLGDSCDFGEERNWVEELKGEFEAKLDNKRQNFQLTTFETAHYVVPAAIVRAVQASGGVPGDVGTLREGIRKALEDETFDSLTPWRKIRFRGGNLEEAPTPPIYQLERRFKRKDEPQPGEWVRLRVSQRNLGFLQGPIVVSLKPKLPKGSGAIDLRLENAADDSTVETARLELRDGETTSHSFPFPGTGLFRIAADGIASLPRAVDVSVAWKVDYLGSLFGALLGSLVAIWLGRGGALSTNRRILVGVIIGVGLTAFSFYRNLLPQLQWIPLPTFSEIPTLNAVASGIFGGFIGPELFMRK